MVIIYIFDDPDFPFSSRFYNFKLVIKNVNDFER